MKYTKVLQYDSSIEDLYARREISKQTFLDCERNGLSYVSEIVLDIQEEKELADSFGHKFTINPELETIYQYYNDCDFIYNSFTLKNDYDQELNKLSLIQWDEIEIQLDLWIDGLNRQARLLIRALLSKRDLAEFLSLLIGRFSDFADNYGMGKTSLKNLRKLRSNCIALINSLGNYEFKDISISSLGPIENADLVLGDLTLFTGTQGNCKNIVLNMIKLLADKEEIIKILGHHDYSVRNLPHHLLEQCFGKEMDGIWSPNTLIRTDGSLITTSFLYGRDEPLNPELNLEKIFFIPAQRSVCMHNGWPRLFSDFEESVPYAIKNFSGQIRHFLDCNKDQSAIFPNEYFMNPIVNCELQLVFFDNNQVIIEQSLKKSIEMKSGYGTIPYNSWSFGQREFLPLLLGYFMLSCSGKREKVGSIDYVIMEEPEIGLEPDSVETLALLILDLIAIGYKVILSTNSPVLLQYAWAFNIKKNIPENEDWKNLPGVALGETSPKDTEGKSVFTKKTVKTYYFHGKDQKIIAKDISDIKIVPNHQIFNEVWRIRYIGSLYYGLVERMNFKE